MHRETPCQDRAPRVGKHERDHSHHNAFVCIAQQQRGIKRQNNFLRMRDAAAELFYVAIYPASLGGTFNHMHPGAEKPETENSLIFLAVLVQLLTNV